MNVPSDFSPSWLFLIGELSCFKKKLVFSFMMGSACGES